MALDFSPIPLVGTAVSAIAGNASSAAARAAAQQQIQAAIDAFKAAGVPPLQATQIVLQKYRSAGKLTPELEQAFTQGATQENSIKTDPNEKAAQLKALASLDSIGTNGGALLSDKATLNDTLNKINADERGSRGAIVADAARRGQMGSGLSLAAQLDNQQNAANRAQQAGLTINGNAQLRALQALEGEGQLGTQMRGQDFSEQKSKADAQDVINRFNTQNQQAVAGTNTQLTNATNQYNLANEQRIADQNTGVQNQQTAYNSQQVQQQYENELKQAAGESGQYNNMANFDVGTANRDSAMWGGIGQGIAQAGGAYQQHQDYQDFLDRAFPKQNKQAPTNPNPDEEQNPNQYTSI
jgi:hypothetical protein